jgi:sugar lactone lactonase YvrE
MKIDRRTAALWGMGLLCGAPARAATAQFSVGDIFVSDFGANHVQQFSPSGTLLRTFASNGTETLGIVVTPSGQLFAANRNSSSTMHIGTVNIFSPDGTLTSTFNIPEITYVDDMALFPDGVLAVTDIFGPVQEYTQSGAFVRTITLPGTFHTGDAVAAVDGSLWVTAETSNVLYNFSETGTLLRSFSLPFEPRDLQVAHDGTLWIGALFDPHIYHYTANGQQISSITTSLNFTAPLALSPDESTIYASYETSTIIARYSTTGQSLGSFSVPDATDLEYITVVMPEPSSTLTLLGVVALQQRRRGKGVIRHFTGQRNRQ